MTEQPGHAMLNCQRIRHLWPTIPTEPLALPFSLSSLSLWHGMYKIVTWATECQKVRQFIQETTASQRLDVVNGEQLSCPALTALVAIPLKGILFGTVRQGLFVALGRHC